MLALLPLVGCGPKPQVAADQPVPVRVRTPNRVQQPVSVAASGSVEANVTAQAAFQIAGRVARFWSKKVRRSARARSLPNSMRPTTATPTTPQRQADAAQAVATKRSRSAPPGTRASAHRLRPLQDEYTRMKYLYDHKSLPANDFKKIEAGYQAAQQRYEMARQGTRDEEKAGRQRTVSRRERHRCMKPRKRLRLPAPSADRGLYRDAADRCGRHGWPPESR